MPHTATFVKKYLYSFIVLFILITISLSILSVQTKQITQQSAATNGIPQFNHVFVIIEENKDYGQIIGSTAAPYITQLANQYGLATNFFAITHPSLPNYIALTSGSTQGITTDCVAAACSTNANNIASELEAGGKTWKEYAESMTTNCQTTDTSLYLQRHNPFVYYTNIKASCLKNDLPYTQFATDLASGNIGNFTFITPNVNDDMHNGTIQQGDTWLKNELPKILQSQAYLQNGLVVVTFDEGQTGAGTTNQIPTILISPLGKQAFKSSTKYTLYSLLKTISDGLGIQPLANAAAANDMTDFFGNSNPSSSPTPTVTPTTVQPSITATPTQSPAQCGKTIPQGNTSLQAAIFLHDIGKGGDNVSPTAPGNTNPLHPQRSVQVTILNGSNQQVGSGQGCITYNATDGFFNGTVDLGNLTSGNYLLQVHVPNYLSQQIPGIITIQANQTNILPTNPHLITGDINNDNQLDILDYNLLIACFGQKQSSSGCTTPPTTQSPGADISDDGHVDGVDYNEFIREISVQYGSQ